MSMANNYTSNDSGTGVHHALKNSLGKIREKDPRSAAAPFVEQQQRNHSHLNVQTIRNYTECFPKQVATSYPTGSMYAIYASPLT